MTGEKIKLELTLEEVELFKDFRKHQDNFILLHSLGLFNIRDGEATISFDSAGTLAQVMFKIVGYKRGYKVIHKVENLTEKEGGSLI
jgi:hypothetical protein